MRSMSEDCPIITSSSPTSRTVLPVRNDEILLPQDGGHDEAETAISLAVRSVRPTRDPDSIRTRVRAAAIVLGIHLLETGQ